jgi:hypothetical protein
VAFGECELPVADRRRSRIDRHPLGFVGRVGDLDPPVDDHAWSEVVDDVTPGPLVGPGHDRYVDQPDPDAVR